MRTQILCFTDSMKYSNIILKNFLFAILIGLCSQVFAQTTTNSIYSRYGIGEIRKPQFNTNFGIGGAGIALKSDRFANFANPASLTSLKMIAFEVAVKSDNYQAISGTQKSQGNNTYFNHLSLSMPIKDWWGLTFGITPLSTIGYDYSYSEYNQNKGRIDYSYIGSGGINKVFVANGFDIAEGLSFGFTTSFLFGGIEREKQIEFLDTTYAFNSSDKDRITVSDVSFDLGIQYEKALSEEYTFIGGVTYDVGNKLSGRRTQLIRSYRGSNLSISYLDTSKFVDAVKTNIKLPSTIGLGVSIEKKESWGFELNYLNAAWSSIEPEGQEEFVNSQTFIAAFRILPNENAYSDYFKRITYSFGASYSNSYIKLNNQELNEYGINFGISLPFKKSISSLTFGLEALRRGENSNGLVQEDFLNFNLGITINDRWFIKRKYD